MKYCTIIVTALMFSCITVHAQKNHSPVVFEKLNHSELPDPKRVDNASRAMPAADMVIGFAGADVRYEKSIAPAITDVSAKWETIAWKGEKVHTQLLIWGSNQVRKLRIKAGALKSSNGGVIPASQVTTGFVRYVMTDGLNKKGGGCGIPPRSEMDSSLAADGIDFITSKNVTANTTQPVWISIEVPRNIPEGEYTGTLQVLMKGAKKELTYTILVKPYTLPLPAAWTFHLDLWQNPYSVARVHSVKPWSAGHFKAMTPYMKMLANAGQKAITVSMIYDPWRGQTYDIYGTMIQWTKKKDGGWVYDYTIFDQWVSYMMELGIDKLINCYSMVPWNNRFYYYDEARGKDTLLVAKTGTPAYEAHWRPMLTDFVQHLKQKGWFHKTAIAMDERPMEDMLKVIRLVKSVDKDFKISLAGTWHPELADDLYDYCVASGEKFDPAVKEQRIKAGKPTTFYTCCVEGYPNTFTFSPYAESAWMGWFAANKNYNGYLRWAYNCWPQHPMQDSRFGSWSAGDTYLVYPGPGSSIRFERLIEGIQDYEKIRLLKSLFIKNGEQEKLKQLQQVISLFEINALPNTSAATMLQQAKAVLNAF